MSGEWATRDKATWGAGPWQDEPDKIHWIDPDTDLDCLMVRNPMGSWCGYVAVTEGHPYFEKDYGEADVDVHGGLTYANFCMESEDPATGVCHVPEPGRPHRVWWLGFDCAHAWDLSPAMNARSREWGLTVDRGETYRDRAYVEGEVCSLARQLAQASA